MKPKAKRAWALVSKTGDIWPEYTDTSSMRVWNKFIRHPVDSVDRDNRRKDLKSDGYRVVPVIITVKERDAKDK